MTNTEKTEYPLFRILSDRKLGVRALARGAGIALGTSSRIHKGLDVNPETAEAVARFLGVHVLDVWDFQDFESVRHFPLRGEFVCPPYPARMARKDGWEARYGTHPQAPARREEARAKWDREQAELLAEIKA